MSKSQIASIPSDLESVSKLSGDGRSNYFIWVSCLYLLRRDRNGFYDCHTKSPTRVCRKSILKISQNFNTTGDLKPQKEVRARDTAWSLTRSGALGTARSDWRSVPKTVEQKHSTSPRSPLLFWEIGVFTVLKELRECWEENLHKSSHENFKRY